MGRNLERKEMESWVKNREKECGSADLIDRNLFSMISFLCVRQISKTIPTEMNSVELHGTIRPFHLYTLDHARIVQKKTFVR